MRRTILWLFTALAVLTAGAAVTFSPEPGKLRTYADDGKKP